ncbi:alpha/beta hydrolase [Psychrobium sp. nBUS_13]|uniref:alpha/beta hydrolase n=1 Tax=Psychrobium sp. nBUS_13 TaxID=3395319 RepID=UPI003EB8177E
MLFITNRAPKGSFSGSLDQQFEFDLDNNAPANSVYFCQRNGVDDYTEIGSSALMSALKRSEPKQILLLIHGFSNLPEPDIFPRAQKLQALFDEKSPDLVQVVPLIWPCDNDFGVIKDYWDDQKSADLSASAFARVLQKFMAWRDGASEQDPCLKRINVLAHSMGNRVLRETMCWWNKYDLANGVPLLFRNTFMVAADVVNETLEKPEKGALIAQASRNVSVYFASDDLALRSSKISNLKNKVASRRLGHTGPEDMGKVANNVYAFDCDDFNNKYDMPKGHSYFLDDNNGQSGRVFNHIYQTLVHGRVILGDSQQRTEVLSMDDD